MIHANLSMDSYQAAPGISKSKLDLIHRSPAHYKRAVDFPEPPTPAMQWGSMFHSLILEPDVFNATYAVVPEGIDRRTKEGKQIWAEWEEANPDKIPVDRPTLVELLGMRDALLACPTAAGMLDGGLAEQSLFWDYEGDHGPVLCKARPDYIWDDQIIDLKTCVDARPDEFSRACWKFRYHVQAAYYMDGLSLATDMVPAGFALIAIEKTAPYGVQVYLVNQEMIEQGRREYLLDLDLYAECAANDEWPGYTSDVQSLMLPRWAQEETSG